MTSLLTALLGVLLLPLFIGTWRASLLGLACQGALIAWVAHRLGADPRTLPGLLKLADLAVVRGLIAPVALYGVMRRQNAAPRNDVIPPNLLSWTLALGIVLAAFNFARAFVPEAGEQRTLVAVATSALLLGFLILATRAGTFSQIVGALRIENAIALFELGADAHVPVGLEVGQRLVVVATILFYRWYLGQLAAPGEAEAVAAPEGPTI